MDFPFRWIPAISAPHPATTLRPAIPDHSAAPPIRPAGPVSGRAIPAGGGDFGRPEVEMFPGDPLFRQKGNSRPQARRIRPRPDPIFPRPGLQANGASVFTDQSA